MPHYFDADPAVASQRHQVQLKLPDLTLDLATDRGVFSWSYIDRGTELLLRLAPSPPTTGSILDLGCGYGPIALAIAHRAPKATVWATDVNHRALELVKENAKKAGIDNIKVALPDEVPTDLKFAAIYSNPPVHIGKDPIHSLLVTWLDRLSDEGSAYLVVQRHLGSDSLADWLTESGYATERLRSRQGYRVLKSTPSTV